MTVRRRCGQAGLALVLVVGASCLGGVSGAADSGGQQAAPSNVLVWPAHGRMLSAPLVVGGSVLGDGSLEMVGDTVTSTAASFDDAPPELALRLFTFVPNEDGGFSAILRFRTPVLVLHSWRGHAVRQTMTVVLRPPSGAAHAVQIQPDGTAMNGSFDSGRFLPDAPGTAVMAGNVIGLDVPASFGVTPAWTVQAIVEVQADEPLHRNRPATGYAAGTSIVPVGLLTGATSRSAASGVGDATTALTTMAAGPTVAPALRPLGVRLEGHGKGLTAVVSLAGPPAKLSAADHAHVDVDLALPGYATLDHPMVVTWLPGGTATSAQALVDAVVVADVPVKVAGNEVRFLLGAATRRKDVATPATPRLDQQQGEVTLPLGEDEAVSSADGVGGLSQQPDSAVLAVDGPKITITPTSTGVAARGLVDATGHFTATSATEMYTGSIDDVGNVVVYRAKVSPTGNVQQSTTSPGAGGTGSVRLVSSTRSTGRLLASASSTTIRRRSDDYDVDQLIEWGLILGAERDLEEYKANNKWYKEIGAPFGPDRPELPFPFGGGDPLEFQGMSPLGAFAVQDGDAQPGGAQGGNPDWPGTPAVDGTSGDSASTVVVRASAGTIPRGAPIGVTTPWTEAG